MSQKYTTFYDDFALPGLDRSKWAAPTIPSGGAITFNPSTGMTLVPSTSNYTMLDSRLNFDLSVSSVYIQYVATFPNLASTAYFELHAPGYNAGTDLYRIGFKLQYSAGWKLTAFITNSAGTILSGTSGPQGAVTVAWNQSAMKFWRFQRLSGGRIYWHYSSDGSNWISLAYIDGWPSAQADNIMYAHLAAGTGSATGSSFAVKSINTIKNIDRGDGYIDDTMDGYNIQSVPTYTTSPPSQFGVWQSVSGSSSIVQDPENSALGQNAWLMSGSGTAVSSVGTTIKDVDFSAKVRVSSSGTTIPAELLWRVNSTSLTTYWFLKITSTDITLGYHSGSDVSVGNTTNSVGTGVFYTYRVIHVGSEIVVYRDTGSGTPGYGRPTTEVFRVTNSNVAGAGLVGFGSVTNTSYFKDISIANGITPPTNPAFGTAQPSQVKPAGWLSALTLSTNLEYMYFLDVFGNTLNILPTFGDIILQSDSLDLGESVARQVLKVRPLGHGAKSYAQFYGEKSVQMTLDCYKTATNEAQYYVDLIKRWCRVGWNFQIVYKPRGDGERYINVQGTSIGRPLVRASSRQKMSVDVALLAYDGGDYETAQQTVVITPGSTNYAQSSGSRQTEPLIRIQGPCTNPLIINQTIESYYPGKYARLGLTVTLDSTEFVEFSIYDDAAVRYMGWTDDAASYHQFLTTRNWFYLEPAPNALYYTSDDLAGSATVIWKDKF